MLVTSGSLVVGGGYFGTLPFLTIAHLCSGFPFKTVLLQLFCLQLMIKSLYSISVTVVTKVSQFRNEQTFLLVVAGFGTRQMFPAAKTPVFGKVAESEK